MWPRWIRIELKLTWFGWVDACVGDVEGTWEELLSSCLLLRHQLPVWRGSLFICNQSCNYSWQISLPGATHSYVKLSTCDRVNRDASSVASLDRASGSVVKRNGFRRAAESQRACSKSEDGSRKFENVTVFLEVAKQTRLFMAWTNENAEKCTKTYLWVVERLYKEHFSNQTYF